MEKREEGCFRGYGVTLVMFSGGKDSFLAAAREVIAGRKVVLLSFDGGALSGHLQLRFCANRLSEHYGRDKVVYVGCYRTTGTVNRLRQNWLNASQADLGAEYPHMTNCQFQCLHCQTSMWVAAIAYAKAKGINRIVCGYKATDEFCTGEKRYLEAMTKLAAASGIEVDVPVYDLEDDYARDLEMGKYGFEPTACEPQCLLGQPAMDGKCPALFDDMIRYYKVHLEETAGQTIEELVPILRIIKLRDVPDSGWGTSPEFGDE